MGFAAVFFSQHLLVTNISVTCFDGVWVGSKQPPPPWFHELCLQLLYNLSAHLWKRVWDTADVLRSLAGPLHS